MLAATVVITATATVTVTRTAGITATATAMTATTTTLGTSRTLIGLMDSVAAKSEGAHCGMHGKFVVDGIETPIEPEDSRPQRKGPVGNAGPVQIQGIIQRAGPSPRLFLLPSGELAGGANEGGSHDDLD